MPKAIHLDLEVQGLPALLRKLRTNELAGPAVREAFTDVGNAGLRAAQGRAPRGITGQLATKLGTRMSARLIPTYVVVRTTATRSSAKYLRYSYPKRLEFDPRSRHRDWLIKAMQSVGLKTILSHAADRIERQFGES